MDVTAKATKARLIEALAQVPDDLTLDEFVEALDILVRSELGLWAVNAGRGIPHAELGKHLGWRRLVASKKPRRTK